MKLISKLFLLILSGVITILYISCSTSKSASNVEVSKIQPKFDYTPKALESVGSTNITIALVNPSFGDAGLRINPFLDFAEYMGKDFEELLTAKGFRIRGPFTQHGEMLYNDKINSDFILEIEIEINFRGIDRKRKTITKSNPVRILTPLGSTSSGAETYYTYSGEGTIIPSLNLTATSTKFSEKLWRKNIVLPAAPFQYQGSEKWTSDQVSLLNEIKQDNVVFNEIAKLLEGQYNLIFELVERQIDPEEMKTIAIEARKIDEKN